MTCVPSVQQPSRRPPLFPLILKVACRARLLCVCRSPSPLWFGLPASLPLPCLSSLCLASVSFLSAFLPLLVALSCLFLPSVLLVSVFPCCPCLLLLLSLFLSLSCSLALLPCLAPAAASLLTALQAPSQFLWVGAFPPARKPEVLPCSLATRPAVQTPSWVSGVTGPRGACWSFLGLRVRPQASGSTRLGGVRWSFLGLRVLLQAVLLLSCKQ